MVSCFDDSTKGISNMIIRLLNSKSFLCVALTAILAVVQAPASAGLIGTDQLVFQAQTELQRTELTTLLARSEVRAQMTRLGVNVDDALSRVNRMTDAELASLYSKLGTLPAGGDALGVVLTLILIFLILDIAGVTDIFPGV
jgi:hypothetical protein